MGTALNRRVLRVSNGSRVTLVAFALAVFAIGIVRPAAAHASGGDRYLIAEIRVSGNSVLDVRDVERAVYPYVGPAGSLERVQQAAAALQALYKARGYPTVGVAPAAETPNDLAGGVVTLDVFEQRIDRMHVRGAQYFSQRQIEAAIPSVQPGYVLNASQMQSELDALARRSPDRTIRPLLRAGDAPGRLDVELEVKDQIPFHANVDFNNLRSANTTDLRLAATVSYGNLFQRQDGFAFTYQTSPRDPDEVKVYSGTYVYRPTWTNTIFAATGVSTDSNVASVGGTTVLGSGTFLITRGIKPLRMQGDLRDSLVFGVDYKDSEDTTGFLSGSDEVATNESVVKTIKYYNFTLGYDANHDIWSGRNRYTLAANWGVRGLGNDADEFETKRFRGEPNYIYAKTRLEREQDLPWTGMTLIARLAAQLTTDSLIGNEQMTLGGYSTVRGYLEAEMLADHGYNTSLQLNWRPSTMPFTTYAFWDWGRGMIDDPLPDEDKVFSLASVGVGVRIDAWHGVTAEALWAEALRDASDTMRGDSLINFLLSYGF